MNVTVTLEQRFNQTPDGAIWTQAAYAYPFWQRYLDIFERVKVIARIQPITNIPPGAMRSDGADVTFVPVPYYVGPRQYLLNLRRITQIVRNAPGDHDALIYRLPSPMVASGIAALQKRRRPYGLEVVGDPYDVFAPGSIRHPLRPLFRLWFSRQLRQQCASACAAAYVTEHTLQKRYPPHLDAFMTSYSSITLPEAAFSPAPRISSTPKEYFRLITVGSLEQLYKGTDLLLEAVSICKTSGFNVQLTIIGDGKYRTHLEKLANTLHIGADVHFLGQIPAGKAVQEQLDRADLFILPSRTEGLPRAMIEAMARGLPCIGSRIGGIPELLPPEDSVSPGDSTALAQKIKDVLRNPERLAQMSARNLTTARQYDESRLRERRMEFYQYLKDKTQEWLEQQ